MNTERETWSAGRWVEGLIVVACCLVVSQPVAAEFTYQPPGELEDEGGTGRVDYEVYVPDMRFPIEEAPAFSNSQVWGHGGMHGPGGGQCDSNNYSYPWWDNYCETRQWEMPLCPGGQGHQGQDIRPATCSDKTHWAVAAEAGDITHIGSYSVNLVTADGTLHRYLHMDPGTLAVQIGDTVSKGERLGLVSNAFGGTPTTIHLHYDIRRSVSGLGQVYVPTYMSLVRSYQELIGQPEEPCGFIGQEGGIIDIDDTCFHLRGNIGTWRTEEAGYGGSLHWTYAYDGAEPDGYARWTLYFEQAQTYRLEVYVDSAFADSEQVRYVLRADGSDQELRLDQSTASGWSGLGEFSFGTDDEQWLEIYDNTGEPFSEGLRFVADAIRLIPVGEDDEEDEDDEGEEEGGTDDDEDSDGAGGGDDDQEANLGAGAHQSQSVTTRSCALTSSPPSSALLLIVAAGAMAWGRRRRQRLEEGARS